MTRLVLLSLVNPLPVPPRCVEHSAGLSQCVTEKANFFLRVHGANVSKT
jgi:hypothetical protein